MALTTTVAGASSDSYATVVEADGFVGWKGSDAWTNASTATKEGVLKAAVAVMDELPYEFAKSDTAQALRFPTVQMYQSGAYYIPTKVKRAQSYLALALLEDPDLMAGNGEVRQVSVTGGFSVTMKDGGNDGPLDYGLPGEVIDLLKNYLWKSGGVQRSWDSARRGWI